MVVEILFQEVCGLYGDSQNAIYLQACLPDAEFIFTKLTDTPYFADNTPQMIYIGCMSEATQRSVIAKLMPLKDRLLQLIDQGVVILATGNAGEIFARQIDYVTENCTTEALGIFDLTVKTDLFNRYNGIVLGDFESIAITGFRSQFSFLYGDNSKFPFIACSQGIGINPNSRLEGMRKNNLFCTQLLGPILPLNPLFCEHLLRLCGSNATAAFREDALAAYEQRLAEFKAPRKSTHH